MIGIKLRNHSPLGLQYSLAAALFIFSVAPHITAQSAIDASTPPGQAPGAPSGSFPLSDFENINLFNGHLNFHLPLLKVGGRGTAGYMATLPIEQRWTVRHESFSNSHFPVFEWWSGLHPGYGPGVLQGRQMSEGCSEGYYLTEGTTRLTFTASDGTEYELRDQIYGGVGASSFCSPYDPGAPGASRGTVFGTADGSAATFTSDTTIYDRTSTPSGPYLLMPSGYLMLRDGTRYRIDGGMVTWMRDRNGNKVSFTYAGSYTDQQITSATDSLNRQVSFEYNISDPPYGTCDRIRFKGFGGLERIVRITRTTLSNALISGESLATYASLFPNLTSSPSAYFDPYIISAVWLPDQRSYQFKYNRYGELARVELPSGGRFEYSWTEFPQGLGPLPEINRRVTEWRAYTETGALAGRSTFGSYQSSDGTQGSVQADHLDFNGSLLSRDKHYFHGHPFTYTTTAPFALPNPIEGREYQTEFFDADGTTILRRLANTWTTCATLATTAINPCVTQTTTTLEPATANLVSKQTLSYDIYNNPTDVYDYAFGSGAAGTLVRRSHTDYLTTNPINGANYATNTNIHIRSLPTQQAIYDTAGEKARSSYEYDNYAASGNNAALTDRYLISGLDTSFTTGYQTRGNVTRGTRWLLATNAQHHTYSQFDIAGNVVRVIDPRGYATSVDFADRLGTPDGNARLTDGAPPLGSYSSFAFATQVTNALGHSSYTQFDYYTGQPVDAEDVNGVVSSSYSENEPLDRPTKVIRAANQGTSVKSQTLFDYDDVNRIVTTTSDLNSFNDPNPLKSQTLYDGLGRSSESRQYETNTVYITVKTNYDALGRAHQTSNPYRNGETVVWTTTGLDALGRVISVTTPDGAAITTSYNGNTVTVTDQAGKKRKSVTDALGRLRQVVEAPNLANFNYETDYDYDVLGNLIKVTQDAQQRYFMYDSLSRLVRTRNPEQDANPTLAQTDPITGNSQWSMAHTYDDNGNLTTRTDARGVVSTYSYDALNRNTSVSYTNDPNSTPATNRYYDGWRDGVNNNIPNSVGRLWQSETTGVTGSRTIINNYDELGRPKSQSQQFYSGGWSTPYTTLRSYNLGGGVTSQTYPSGRTVSYTYDNAGRTNSFSGNLGGTNRSYASGITYSAFGGLTKEQFGTDTSLYHKLHYNIRGQLYDVRVSNVNDEWGGERGALVNYYSTQWAHGGSGPDNNGNVLMSQTIINSYYMEDRYSYDTLNRLTSVAEWQNGTTNTGVQTYAYDRYGNRTIDAVLTWGQGINNKQFTVNPANNRLSVPGGQGGTMTYDLAGNLTTDTYSGAGITRAYDAENRMTTETQAGSVVAGAYSYNADGQRVRRITAVGGQPSAVTTWQVYGMDGELLAEYAPNGSPSSPQKEYGYRNGQLLITATMASSNWGSPPDFGTNPVAIGLVVKATHITELRNAINALRGHMSLPAYSWQYSATTSDWISANPVIEMRTALDQALGPPASPGYAAGLATGQSIKAIHLQELQQRILSAWSSGTSVEINWLVADHLGTPRMVIDQTGSLANVKRHDYLPFGEELLAGQGGRTTTLGYSGDAIRQKFASKERDNETGLDYFLARYYSSTQGRFTSPDEFTGGPHEVFGDVLPPTPLLYGEPTEPQSLNKYNYCLGNPLRFIDPDGHQTTQADGLIIATPKVTETAVNIAIGVGKVADNTLRGMNNIMAEFGAGDAKRVDLHSPSNLTQAITMVVTEDVMILGAFLGGRSPAGVMAAEAKETAVVAAEVGNATASAKNAGIYEFADAANKGRTYVGQSGNMPKRLQQHGRAGRLAPGTSATTTQVGGGKLPREVAEQGRINQLGGTRNVPGSRTSNIRNPVSKQRQKKLGNEE